MSKKPASGLQRYSLVNLIIKILLFAGLAYVIQDQLRSNSELLPEWLAGISLKLSSNWIFLLTAILLMPLNLWLESLKWKVMVNKFEAHSAWKSVMSVLSGITAGMVTPGRLGDYVGKLMFISPSNNWKAVWANMTGGIAMQLSVLIGGLAGASVYLSHHLDLAQSLNRSLLFTLAIVGILLALLYYHLHWLHLFSRKLPAVRLFRHISESLSVTYSFRISTLNRVLILAMARYLVFLLQYLMLLAFWDIGPGYLLLAAISVIFLLQSAVPLPPVIGILARGEIALLVLGGITASSFSVLSAAFSLWIINLAIPALFGLILVLNTNITKTLGYD